MNLRDIRRPVNTADIAKVDDAAHGRRAAHANSEIYASTLSSYVAPLGAAHEEREDGDAVEPRNEHPAIRGMCGAVTCTRLRGGPTHRYGPPQYAGNGEDTRTRGIRGTERETHTTQGNSPIFCAKNGRVVR